MGTRTLPYKMPNTSSATVMANNVTDMMCISLYELITLVSDIFEEN
jgi:hypothetical protein